MDIIIGAGRHDIIITEELANSLSHFLKITNFSSIVVIADENTRRHCLPLIEFYLPSEFHLITIDSGEKNKNLQTSQEVWDHLLRFGTDRDALIINLGGGLVSDLGGFAASVYKRGIRFINIPTSLLGMVDASAGGKTGVDLNHFKNMVGTFAFPELVIIAPLFLNTLPDKEWKNGIAEMIKHGLIADAEIWSSLKHDMIFSNGKDISPQLKDSVTALLEKGIRVKAQIVSTDPFEKNERMILNFGHTTGHAFESLSLLNDEKFLSHGEAIAMGIICELYLSYELYGFDESALHEISTAIAKFFPYRKISPGDFPKLTSLMRSDKKSSGGKMRMVLLNEIGSPVMHQGISDDLIFSSFRFYNTQSK